MVSIILIAFLYGISLLVIFGRQKNVIIPLTIITITFPEMAEFVPDDFKQLVYIMYVLMIAGIVIFIFRGGKTR